MFTLTRTLMEVVPTCTIKITRTRNCHTPEGRKALNLMTTTSSRGSTTRCGPRRNNLTPNTRKATLLLCLLAPADLTNYLRACTFLTASVIRTLISFVMGTLQSIACIKACGTTKLASFATRLRCLSCFALL